MLCIVKEVPKYHDLRGSVYCPLDDIGYVSFMETKKPEYLNVRRTYVINNWKAGTIRAWHLHTKGWTGLHVIHGAAQVVGLPMEDFKLTYPWLEDEQIGPQAIVLDADAPKVFWVPPGYYNGTMSLVDDTKILVYSGQTFEQVKHDDSRRKPTKEEIEQYFTVPIK